MDDFFGIISVIVFGCGIYGFYAYFQMKRDGHINETLLLGKSYTEQMCKDKESYMKKALPAVLIFAVVATIYGAIDMFHYFVQPIMLIDVIGMVAFFIMLIWFMVYTTKLKNKYF
ncbi:MULTISPECIES: hypothetical protein [Lachnospiraceae]|jgi:hypothetical protein|uniref:DUF3784 domain-containing protein n=1 Tax=Faecalicatena acetigenes TaxID=2981790 RepID=A0ABT2T8C2_9FIRM|nr:MULTISPECIES: hypothetical protein [Lachnospiraceae]MCU6746519.1 hypothetical protein [Faecalicatena acetigenes]RGT73510.1 hypothetical protein DWX08_05805 [Ruminococcus sp. AF18-22]SCH22631.1 Uncharacterised protein [uncultured Clostridium sp.]